MNACVPARKISNIAKKAAFKTANKIRLLIPIIFSFGSTGKSLLIINPATANIIDNSQETPINNINEVLAPETVHKAWPEAE